MKNAIRISAILALLISITYPSKAEGTTKEIKIKSSVVCNMCKDTIEEGLAYTKGIKTVRVDVENNEIYVKYKEDKITELEIKKAINKLGYVADDMKPTKEAYDSLHDCCKAGGVCD